MFYFITFIYYFNKIINKIKIINKQKITEFFASIRNAFSYS